MGGKDERSLNEVRNFICTFVVQSMRSTYSSYNESLL